MRSRYRAFHHELKSLFGSRVDRISIQAALSCPNVDGTRARGGCTFCQEASYVGLTYQRGSSISDQLEKGVNYIRKRYGSDQFIIYFQQGTNTHAPAPLLKEYFEMALAFPGVVGLSISTRPDCLPDNVCDLLEELNQKTYLWIELGIPSHLNGVNERLNRAHTVEEFKESADKLSRRGIRVCAHLILGLPGETAKDTIEKAQFFNRCPIQGVKIHNLVVFNKTVLAKQYNGGHYQPLTLEKYATQCTDFLEHARPDLIIHRLMAHGPRHLTVAPEWSINKWNALNAIHAELERRDTWQGRLWD